MIADTGPRYRERVEMQQISTIGYEGAELRAFIDTLKDAGICHVVDVREVAASRRKGFSKNALRDALEESGLKYSHFKALGDPKDGRAAMRRGDRDTFRHIFSARLETFEAMAAFDLVVEIARSESAVLLCYEREPLDCHRKMITDKMMLKEAFAVRHLGVQSRRGKQRGDQDGRAYASV